METAGSGGQSDSPIADRFFRAVTGRRVWLDAEQSGPAPGLARSFRERWLPFQVSRTGRDESGLPAAPPMEIFRTGSFRLAATFSLAFASSTLLLFAFIYWETAVYETNRVDAVLVDEAAEAAGKPLKDLLRLVDIGLANDLHRQSLAALFDASGGLVAGNLRRLPDGLPVNGRAYGVHVDNTGLSPAPNEPVRAVARHLPGGYILVIGRYMDQFALVRHTVLRALVLGAVPAVLLALVVGTFMSLRAVKRVRRVRLTADRIMGGDLRGRLPTRGTRDDVDRLSATVNRMLDEIERLMDEIKGVGDDIAHDLRTPLTRVRVKLERTRNTAQTQEDLHRAIDGAIQGLDHALAIITALLRISEIEAGRRRAGFGDVDLAALVHEVADLYRPIAEEKTIQFSLEVIRPCHIIGDHDLLLEAVANLLGNAIKFTPADGSVRLILDENVVGPLTQPVVRVCDTGPGIAPEERSVVLKRFYRSDKSRHIEGTGLGLSLVAAIARLHDIDVVIGEEQPGCKVELVMASRTASAPAAVGAMPGRVGPS